VSIGLTLDTGTLIAVDRGDRRTWRYLDRMARGGSVPVVPTPVLAEAWRGPRQARLGQLLRFCRIEPLDELTARRAGELCGRAGTDDPVDAIDAIVVVSAARRGGYVLTADAGDLTRLVSHLPEVGRPLAIRSIDARS